MHAALRLTPKRRSLRESKTLSSRHFLPSLLARKYLLHLDSGSVLSRNISYIAFIKGDRRIQVGFCGEVVVRDYRLENDPWPERRHLDPSERGQHVESVSG